MTHAADTRSRLASRAAEADPADLRAPRDRP
jgi:hypothetical protein